MGGKPRDPAYWRNWRAAHPEYRERERQRQRRRVRGDRTAEYARRPSRAVPSLLPVYPHLQRGSAIAFWEDELRIDVEQERALAVLEGRDPDEAERRYRDAERRQRPMSEFHSR